ncbi:hypothetical protein MNBD_GAMMA22-743 [hydrothermal vent metagenome]|uniref:Xcc1710-like domain-containing protein n=1 Tax=hydrothermal vent metagenome TaxID=652676 RepID=A0A3B0ZJ47_9ZZZZ
MAFTRENSIGNAIHSYATGEIQIIQNTLTNGIVEATLNTITSNFIINPESIILDWSVNKLDDITEELITPIVTLEPDLVILGVGQKMALPAVAINLMFQKFNIGIEVMDTAAACRTYNFLLTEGRNVAAALIQITE